MNTMTGPFSLGQAEDILSSAYCPVCGHKLGAMHPVIGKRMCADQILAGEVVRKHRKLAEENVAFQTAADLLEATA